MNEDRLERILVQKHSQKISLKASVKMWR